jgi:Zn-dependent protease with chaperone function
MSSMSANLTFFLMAISGSALAGYYVKKNFYDMTFVESDLDHEKYLVRNLPDKKEAADRLAEVRRRTLLLMKHFKQTNSTNQIAIDILKNFDAAPIRFSESTPDSSYTSYTLNKGEKMYVCLRQKNATQDLVSANVLTFVTLHELGHIGTREIGHTPLFWNNFAWILKQAEELGIYEYQDFAEHPVEYCGISITDQPKYKENSIDAKAKSQ